MKRQPQNLKEVLAYARAAVRGKSIVGADVVLACQRFLDDYSGKTGCVLRTEGPETAITIIERTLKLREGIDPITGETFHGKPFRLQPWQKFIVYNILGFFDRKSGIRKYREAFIMVPRKSGKTPFVAALAWALALMNYKAGASIYVVAANINQAMESFKFLQWNAKQIDRKAFRIRDNSAEHSIHRDFGDGFIDIRILAYNPAGMDSFKANVVILDEIHAFKGSDAYDRMKEATLAAGTEGLTIGITTAGDNQNSFCYRKQERCIKILKGVSKGDSQFAFISRADMDPETGEIDYTNPIQIQKANPSYGVTVSPVVLLEDAREAAESPDKRRAFISRNLCRYVAPMKAYFDLDKVRLSDQRYSWNVEELARLPVRWYGGVDLSKLNDLTAACLYGTLHSHRLDSGATVDVDIIIPHAWFPAPMAHEKAQKEGIPVFGWEEDGWLTMTNAPTVDTDDVVKWFQAMRGLGFKIVQVGHDSKFSREYVIGMKGAHFRIIDQPQYYWAMSAGFRKIEYKIANRQLYYCHAEPFEYCIGNVRAVERSNQQVLFTKLDATENGKGGTARIDVFDAAVMACIRHDEDLEQLQKQKRWSS